MMKRARYKRGSVVFDRRRGTWNFLWWEGGKRRSRLVGSRQEFPTKAAAWRAAEKLGCFPLKPAVPEPSVPTVYQLLEGFRSEYMTAERRGTKRSDESRIKNHIIPKWGNTPVTELTARDVQLWLQALALAPKSRAHIRRILGRIVEYAMWRGSIPAQVNPLRFVRLVGVNRPANPRRSVTRDEFDRLLRELQEPFRTIAQLCYVPGIRISEIRALRWSDIDWLQGKISVERSIVGQFEDTTKTPESRKRIPVGPLLIRVLQEWRQQSQFTAHGDYIFASPVQLGALPWSYPHIWRVFVEASKRAGVPAATPHVLRHSYRSRVSEVGASLELQRECMRHAAVTTTLGYGEPELIEQIRAVNIAIEKMVIGSQNGLQAR